MVNRPRPLLGTALVDRRGKLLGNCDDLARTLGLAPQRLRGRSLENLMFLVRGRGLVAHVVPMQMGQTKMRCVTVREPDPSIKGVDPALVSVIGHDLRSPFNALIGFLEMIELYAASVPVDKTQDYARSAQEAAARITALIDQLLDWLRASSLADEPDWTLLSVRSVTKEVVKLLQPVATMKGISLEQHVSETLTAHADHRMLATILRNIVSNAIKFSPRGGAVTLSAQRLGDETVRIAVTDQGAGFDPTLLHHTPKRKSMRTTHGTAGETGSGLGLGIVRGFASRMGIRVAVERPEGGGTRMVLLLPP